MSLGGGTVGVGATPDDVSAKRVAGAGDDHGAVIVIARHLTECIGKLFVRTPAPEQLSVFAMECHLQDAVLPLHLDEIETILVVVELAHRNSPRFRLIPLYSSPSI